MALQTGIAITIKAFLPIGKSFEEQFAAMTKVNDAHLSGDYSEVLKACGPGNIVVKAERQNRRAPDPAPAAETGPHPAPPGDAPTDPAVMQTRARK